MGAISSIPNWSKVGKSATYNRELIYLDGNNQVESKKFICTIETDGSRSSVTIFDVDFSVQGYNEICTDDGKNIKNAFFVDGKGIVRRSLQYHGEALGSILIERLDQ